MTTMVPAVERAIRILNAFKDGRGEYGVTELSQALQINKSTVHGIVRTLSAYHVLEQDPGSRKYRLGPGLIELGDLAQSRQDVRQMARPFLMDLMEQTQETVLLGEFKDDGITIIDVVEPPRELRITASSGQRLPYSAGSFGRVFMAWLDQEELDRLLTTQSLQRFTATTITDTDRLRANLEQVRVQGFAVDDTEEYVDGVWGVSVPIHDARRLRAVLTVVGFTSHLPDETRRSVIAAATLAGRQISLGMGAPSEVIQ